VSAKALYWVGGALARLRAFPRRARRRAGHELFQVQLGLHPSDWKPMPSIGPGAIEIRIHENGEYRVIYLASFAEAVYVLHAFEKRTQRTRQADVELARRNLAEVLRHRRR